MKRKVVIMLVLTVAISGCGMPDGNFREDIRVSASTEIKELMEQDTGSSGVAIDEDIWGADWGADWDNEEVVGGGKGEPITDGYGPGIEIEIGPTP